ncbi:hypothetical protein DFH28DRAFT_1140348 [Melampsora americana]|nr:hypothetical protein DFH28DRAFT_1140348 [Melampsora americana]
MGLGSNPEKSKVPQESKDKQTKGKGSTNKKRKKNHRHDREDSESETERESESETEQELKLDETKSETESQMSHRNDKPGWAKQNKDIREIWDNMSIDQKMVFKTPYFFALAKLPDLSRPSAVVELGNDGQDIDKEDISAEVTSPPVHQLSEEDELLYRPIFEELVDVEKSTTQSRKSRNECFNNQPPAQIISGLLSCSSQDEHIPEKVFPKKDDPAGVIKSQGWPIRLVLKRPDSALLPEELDLGFRLCDDGQKKKWLSDIKNGLFYIEKIPPSEFVPPQKGNKKRKRPTSTTANQDTSSNQTTTETSSTS